MDDLAEKVSMLPLEFQATALKWLGSYPSENTKDAYLRSLQKVLRFFCEKLNRSDLNLLAMITPPLVTEMQEHLAQNGSSENTILAATAALRSFARAVYLRNPSINLTGLIMLRTPAMKPRPYHMRVIRERLKEHIEADRELNRARSRSEWIVLRNEAICNLFADTGAKSAQVVALDYPSAIQARSTGMITFPGTKERTLPLSRETLVALDLYVASCEFPFDERSPLFFDHKGDRLSAGMASSCVGDISQRLGSGHSMTPLGIRRNRIVEMFEVEHLPETIIAERLGIRSVATISEILSDAGCYDRFRNEP
ncbi:site-specific integrase [Mesorhizobium sp.]|uniref:tyrosine-type recombinase/integrase n=1 Tax=Mesorhizobium sp. TaxID=1871066 RepID=UPI000FE6DA57|nr:site-specific integrase [Mesorhizobium sp.]RWM39945.1 MAG: hypothetical protein EOR75_12255 [Mesorhizobium sp.]